MGACGRQRPAGGIFGARTNRFRGCGVDEYILQPGYEFAIGLDIILDALSRSIRPRSTGGLGTTFWCHRRRLLETRWRSRRTAAIQPVEIRIVQ